MQKFEGWPHIIEAQQFSREWIEKEFLPLTEKMQEIFTAGGRDILKGKRMVSFFYQPSTRTRMSFEMAMSYLGGQVVFASENAGEFSSASKGETFYDTISVINQYKPDVIVLRYNKALGGSKFASEISKVPIINAGDREPGQHPSQSLLDLLTIYKKRGAIDGLKIAMVGDLLNGRTVRSLSYLLGKFKDIEIYFVSPENFKMQNDVKEYLNRHNVKFSEFTDIRKVAPIVDVIYQTRTQKECGVNFDRADNSLGYYIIDKNVANSMRAGAIIMHPLPRVDEIVSEVDNNPRAVYLTTQVECGLFTRMALLKMILNPDA